MAINALKSHLLDELKTARAELQDVKPEDLNYMTFTAWLTKWHGTTFIPANRVQGVVHSNAYPNLLRGSDNFPPHVFHEIRADLVKLIDASTAAIDETQEIPDPLVENISKIRDPKLSELLNEFRRIKDIAPNAAGLTLRPIIVCIIHERAKALQAEGKLPATHTHLATRTDFNPGPTIQDAISAHIFDKADEKFLNLFNPSHKAIFDNVAHSVGKTALVGKDHLASLMEPLNKLLSYVVV